MKLELVVCVLFLPADAICFLFCVFRIVIGCFLSLSFIAFIQCIFLLLQVVLMRKENPASQYAQYIQHFFLPLIPLLGSKFTLYVLQMDYEFLEY